MEKTQDQPQDQEPKHNVHALIDPRTGIAFYIGKGSGTTLSPHYSNQALYEKGSNKVRNLKIQDIWKANLDFTFAILFQSDDVDECYQKQIDIIKELRDQGIRLTNKTAGGKGVTAYGVKEARCTPGKTPRERFLAKQSLSQPEPTT